MADRARQALREFYFERPQRALVGAAALLAFVGVAALTIPPGPLRIDAAWSEWMTDIRSPGLDSLALVFNSLGRGVLRALSLVAVGGVLAWGRRWRALVAFAVVEAIAPALSTILKVAVDRPRPPEARLHSAGASFTSGHAVYAAATSAALVVLFLELGPRRRIGWILAALCTATMAWSRTYLQVHWLSDVVVGAALGAGVAFGVFACVSSARHEPARGDVAAPVDRQPHVLAVPGQHR